MQRFWILLIGSMAGLLAGSVRGDDPRPPKPAVAPPSLDQRLLDDLDSELFDHVPSTGKPQQPGPGRSVNPLDGQLLDQLGEGEDVGKADPLSHIANTMRAVEERIGARDTSDATQQLQQQIISDLAKLIEVQQKKCQCSGNSQQSMAQSSSSASSRPGDSPSRDSTNRLGQSPEQRGSLEDVQHMMKQVWGQLPDRLREQIQSASVEEFLPKYERLIEQYYQRLAEQDVDRP